METTMWITKDETCQAVSGMDYQNSNIFNTVDQQQQQQLTNDCNKTYLHQQLQQRNSGFDYYQDLDNLVSSLDDFFLPNAMSNGMCSAMFSNSTDKKSNQINGQEQQKVLANLLASEPLNIKTENLDSSIQWSNGSYQCQSPDSGVNLETAFSPNGSDLGSDYSASPSVDLESPRSVASSFCSSGSNDSGILMNGQSGEVGFEIYHDLIMRHLVQDIKATCVRLTIEQDPKLWSPDDCRAWLTDMSAQYHLTQVPYDKLNVSGTTLCNMSLAQFNQCFPNGGETVHAQLQIWNSANEYCKRQSSVASNSKNSTASDSSSSASMIGNYMMLPNHTQMQQQQHHYKMEEEPIYGNNQFVNSFQIQQSSQYVQNQVTTPQPGYSLSSLLPSPGSCSDSGLSADLESAADTASSNCIPATANNNNNIHLWQFLRELLDQQEKYSHCVRWIDHSAGIFKIEDSHKLARLWGQRKNRPAMNYDKLSRSLRQYYKKNILKKTTRSQRLVYQFLHPYHMC